LSFTPAQRAFTPAETITRAARATAPGISPRTRADRGRDVVVRRLYDKAKRLGTWDPAGIVFERDIRDWRRLSAEEQSLLLWVTSLFVDGEEAVTRDLLPLAEVLVHEGRLDDELFLTAWLWEEGKHADLFHRFDEHVLVGEPSLRAYRTAPGTQLLDHELPSAMNALYTDPLPTAQTRALVTYCLCVEGVLAEMGHRIYHELLEPRDLMPGLRQGLSLVRRDESRHVAFGMHVMTRLRRADSECREVALAQVAALRPLFEGLMGQLAYALQGGVPWSLAGALDKPLERLERRLDRIDRAAQTD